MNSNAFPFSLAFGAPTLADSIDLALTAIGGRENVRETSLFDLQASRNGVVALADVTEELFHLGAGTALQIASKLGGEFVVISPPGDDLSCWCGLADLCESRAGLRVAAMIRSDKALFVTIGIGESPLPNNSALADGRPLGGSVDYALAVAHRTVIEGSFQFEINRSLVKLHPEAAWIESAFAQR